jgi:hypothetical protein
VELGVGMGRLSLRLIEVAQMFAGEDRVRYVGIDLFEARPAISPGMTLKRAHRLFRATGADSRLIPGDPLTALARAANSLANTDFVVIAADQDGSSVAQSMFYLPRTALACRDLEDGGHRRPGDTRCAGGVKRGVLVGVHASAWLRITLARISHY